MSHSLHSSSGAEPESDDTQDGFTLIQRRIRHITSIQVRNLTPFPVRDAVASALSQPAEQPQFNPYGQLSDDLDVTLPRKRSRRISTNSTVTHHSLKSDENAVEEVGHGSGSGTGDSRGQRARVSFSGGTSIRPRSGSVRRTYSTSGSAPTVRPHRPRTSSIASSISSHYAGPTTQPSIPPSAPLSVILPDNSQTGLEKVIKTRLVETFLAIFVLASPIPPEPPSHHKPSSLQRFPPRSTTPPNPSSRMSPQTAKTAEGTLSRKSGKPSPFSPTDKPAKAPRRDSSASLRMTTSKSVPAHLKSSSTSNARQNGKVGSSPSPKFLAPPIPPSPCNPSPTIPGVPDYLSPIHRPSTNPIFPIDIHSVSGFAESTDLSGQKLKIEIWGKVGGEWRGDRNMQSVKGKEREREGVQSGNEDVEWKILDEWYVEMKDLMPLPEDPTEQSHLPSNTLLITLSPPGRTFYLSQSIFTRSPTPSTGYTSDPESEVRKAKQAGDYSITSGDIPTGQAADITSLSRRRHRRGTGGTLDSVSTSKTAGWQDLFKLVTLQSLIADNGASLSNIVRDVDKTLENDVTFTLRRELSKREARVEELKSNCRSVAEESSQLRSVIQDRAEKLRQRKEMISLAMQQHNEEASQVIGDEQDVLEERARVLSLRARFPPTRTTLLSTLATIFPIELYSPPDLLYTILDVPLPIPLSSADPAPPLTLPAHKDVTEDAVATSLGYAAQVVQLLAAYLGKGLVYPITCIGSRSLIRDGISAMVGPRMFPLFSRGVDTYRFEYGVFLLNKNIEMLMADRDLRALDMRHTLPNLKNLLLTLTDGEGVHLRAPHSLNSPVSSFSGLESPPRARSPIDSNSTTPKANVDSELPADGDTPPASGSTTPTAPVVEASKRARPFLGLSPLTVFLRSRYPSSSRPTAKTLSEEVRGDEEDAAGPSSALEANGTGADEEDDHRTIHGVERDIERGPNGHAPRMENDGQERVHEEKLYDVIPSPFPASSPSAVP